MNNANYLSEADRLDWLVQILTERAGSGLQLLSVANLDVLSATTTMVRIGLSYARGVNSLLRVTQVDATPPLQRSLYELWVEFRFLLRHGDAVKNANKFSFCAMLELVDFAKGRENLFDSSALESMTKGITSFEARNPEVVQVVREQRKKRQHHWSGMSRSHMERKVGVSGISVYKMLSWEAHAVLIPIRDISVVRNASEIIIDFQPQNTHS